MRKSIWWQFPWVEVFATVGFVAFCAFMIFAAFQRHKVRVAEAKEVQRICIKACGTKATEAASVRPTYVRCECYPPEGGVRWVAIERK